MAKTLLWFLVLQVFYGVLSAEEDSLCSWLDESKGHLMCRNGFSFPIEEKFAENLKELSIHSENVTDLKSEDFKNLTELKYIDLSKSNIQNIDQDAFVNLKHLEVINLSQNKDLKLPTEGPLFYSDSVRELILRNTGITTLPEDAFKEMPSLEILNLLDNNLEDIEKSIENAKSIEKLFVTEGNLDSLILCERTSLKLVEKISVNSEKKEISKIHDCVSMGEELIPTKETSTKPDEVKESTTLQVNGDIHKEFCMDEKNFGFNGKMECKDEEDGKQCELSCPEGMKPDKEFVNPYKCLYASGQISPVVPKCLQVPDNENGTGGSGDEPSSTTEKVDDKPQEKPKEEEKMKVEDKSEENQIDHKQDDTTQHPENKIEIEVRNQDYHNETHDSFGRAYQTNMYDVGESKPEEEGVNGSSVVLGIIIVVLVLGALGMGYKYWKNHRGYHNTRTEDVEEGKELKTINSANKALVSSEQNE